jgi:ABC-type Fe3+ transport system permease subunit
MSTELPSGAATARTGRPDKEARTPSKSSNALAGLLAVCLFTVVSPLSLVALTFFFVNEFVPLSRHRLDHDRIGVPFWSWSAR